MPDSESVYRKVDGKVLIEIKLSTVAQLFNTFDPAPFHAKELDFDAERYIVDTVKDFPAGTSFKIIIYLPPDLLVTDRAKQIIPAIKNHFEYKSRVTERKLRTRFRYGRGALLVGLTFLFIALVARHLVTTIQNHLLAELFADALLIIGWVAMWEPVTVLLYELWPIHQQKKTYERISTMEIEVLPSA
ncbi:MAG TPA: hypothetical protein HA272_05680 [Methanoregula sp.]|nr:hypothetical protein [Methanoregula sp.]